MQLSVRLGSNTLVTHTFLLASGLLVSHPAPCRLGQPSQAGPPGHFAHRFLSCRWALLIQYLCLGYVCGAGGGIREENKNRTEDTDPLSSGLEFVEERPFGATVFRHSSIGSFPPPHIYPCNPILGIGTRNAALGETRCSAPPLLASAICTGASRPVASPPLPGPPWGSC